MKGRLPLGMILRHTFVSRIAEGQASDGTIQACGWLDESKDD